MSFSPPFVIRLGIESCREHLGSSDTHALTEISQGEFARYDFTLPPRSPRVLRPILEGLHAWQGIWKPFQLIGMNVCTHFISHDQKRCKIEALVASPDQYSSCP
jgi:hypothetical protein